MLTLGLMCALPHPASFARVSHLAEQRSVHQAFQWLHLHEQQIMRWQAELVAIPAPPFGEQARAEWILERFKDLGLEQTRLDAAGNALGVYPGTNGPSIQQRLSISLRPDLSAYRYRFSSEYSDSPQHKRTAADRPRSLR